MSFRLAFAVSLILASCTAWADDTAAELVSAYYSAYNAHDIDRMMSMVSDDVKWLQAASETNTDISDVADDDDVLVLTENRFDLALALEDYFDAFPSARSIIRSIEADDNVVSVFEEAVWDSSGAPKSQCAAAVYRIDEGVIVSVMYSSEQPCDD